MIKLIVFDLDGVLVEAKQLHYEALNEALMKYAPDCVISWNEHLSKYDGLKTNQKLEMLFSDKGLKPTLYGDIWDEKQRVTNEKLKNIIPQSNLIGLLKKLSEDGFKIACCSNSIRKTVLTVLSKLNIIEYFDQIQASLYAKKGKTAEISVLRNNDTIKLKSIVTFSLVGFGYITKLLKADTSSLTDVAITLIVFETESTP
jgi:beta-phosphoglucomutase-like phosphatase (HAD superfamily)